MLIKVAGENHTMDIYITKMGKERKKKSSPPIKGEVNEEWIEGTKRWVLKDNTKWREK